MMTAVRLVLASASPRRAELLSAAGFSFDTLAVDIDESVRPGEDPAAYVRRLALEKSARAQAILLARAGSAGQQGRRDRRSVLTGRPGPPEDLVVLGADTAVVVDGEILRKPRDAVGRRADAAALVGPPARGADRRQSAAKRIESLGGVETTAVDFVSLTEADVAWYRGERRRAGQGGRLRHSGSGLPIHHAD